LDDEQVLERVRLFKHAAELRIACADVQGTLPLMQVSDRLSWLAEVVVQGCLQSLQHAEQQRQSEQPALPNLAVIAFGKLGGLELSYGSDLDLVYLTDGQSQTDPAIIKLTRQAQGLSRMLSLRTVSGQMYEVDLRLRPDGNAGPLVSTISAMREYYHSRAWLWELQALVRARCIAGESNLMQAFEQLRRDVLCQPREQQVLAHEVLAMRQKLLLNKSNTGPLRFNLKHDLGGITDIEFMVQYAILANAHREPALCRYSDNVRQLAILAEANFIAPKMAQDLSEIYCQYRNASHHMALQTQQIGAVDPAQFSAERALVQLYWKKCFAAYLD
jgi:glutamate-ammonia-ligase adenylyltransferase